MTTESPAPSCASSCVDLREHHDILAIIEHVQTAFTHISEGNITIVEGS